MVLGGGIGIDDIAFSRQFQEVISIEPNIELNKLSAFNFSQLSIKNIVRIADKSENFLLQNNIYFDCIYSDPDRRDEKGRQILLKEHQPNLIELYPLLSKITNTIVIKCSPMYDYEMALQEISNITNIYAISLNGEIKEMLLISKPNVEVTTISLHCVDIQKNSSQEIVFEGIETNIELEKSETNDLYFYEAGNTLVKMRTFLQYAQRLGLRTVDLKVPYFTSNEKLETFLGRKFKILSFEMFNKKTFLTYLKDNDILQLNLKVRGMPFKTAEIIKNFKLKEGGEDYFFLLPYQSNKYMIHCKKVDL